MYYCSNCNSIYESNDLRRDKYDYLLCADKYCPVNSLYELEETNEKELIETSENPYCYHPFDKLYKKTFDYGFTGMYGELDNKFFKISVI